MARTPKTPPPVRPAPKVGRPTLCTPETLAKLLQAIKAGNYVEDAVEFAGIGTTTYYRWMQQADDPDPANDIYREFRDATKAARAEAKVGHVLNIHQAGKKNWQASAWWLERSFPDQFGRRRLEVSGPEGGPLRVDVEGLEADIEALIAGGVETGMKRADGRR